MKPKKKSTFWNPDQKQINPIKRNLLLAEPRNEREFKIWAKTFFGWSPLDEKVCEHHQTQMDWCRYWLNGGDSSLVRACRNGGKTALGAMRGVHRSHYMPKQNELIIGGCLHPETKVLTPSGPKEIWQVQKNERIWNGHEWTSVVSRGSRKLRAGEKLIGVRVGGLCTTWATPDHLFYVYSDIGGEQWKPAREIKKGDWLIAPYQYQEQGWARMDRKTAFLWGIFYSGASRRVKAHSRSNTASFVIGRRQRERAVALIEDITERIGDFGIRPFKIDHIKRPTRASVISYFEENFRFDWRVAPEQLFTFTHESRRDFFEGFMRGVHLWGSKSKNIGGVRFWTETLEQFYTLALLSQGELVPRLEAHLAPYQNRMRGYMCKFNSKLVENLRKWTIPVLSYYPEHSRRNERARHFSSKEYGKCMLYKISKIEIDESFQGLVWDLEADKGEQFLTLGGLVHNSKKQSERMYAHFQTFYEQPEPAEHVEGSVTKEGVKLYNGSEVEIVASSKKAFRGGRKTWIACDEADDVKPQLWNTLQYTIDGATEENVPIDVLSTVTEPTGLMVQLMARYRQAGIPIFSWCLWEIIEPCKDRMCSNCDLSHYCGGRAKDKRTGFYKINKAIQVLNQSLSADAFEVEMLLESPRPMNAMLVEFSDRPPWTIPVAYNPNFQTYRSFDWGQTESHKFCCLWLQYSELLNKVFVIDELVLYGYRPTRLAELVLERERKMGYSNIFCSYGDPSGASYINEFESFGIRVQTQGLGTQKKARLQNLKNWCELDDKKEPFLVINMNCDMLRASMVNYNEDHFNKVRGAKGDDPVDTLLYFVAGFSQGKGIGVRGGNVQGKILDRGAPSNPLQTVFPNLASKRTFEDILGGGSHGHGTEHGGTQGAISGNSTGHPGKRRRASKNGYRSTDK